MGRREFLVGVGTAAVTGWAAARAGAARAATGPRFAQVDEFDAQVPTAWFDLALDLVRTTPGYSPPVASRAFGYAGVALYEALVPGMAGYRSLGGLTAGLRTPPAAGRNTAYHWPTVANTTLAVVLRYLFPTAPAEQQAAVNALESSLADRFRPGLPPGVAARSIGRGHEVAAAIFDASTTDGGREGEQRNFPPYDPPVGPGRWEPTPPDFLPALQPHWGGNRCLAIPGGAACPPGDHPAFSEDTRSAFHAEAVEAYEAVNNLTAEQEAIARFWSDDPGTTPTPPGHSLSIATQVLRHERSSLAAAAETYAKVGIAVCDAFIACWHQKYVYNLLRPVTYIHRHIDPDWTPLLVTPPFPEYTSGHSVQSGAAFQVLTDLFGDDHAFVDHTHDDHGLPPRTFGSFHEAADEAAISRLYGGIHFDAAIVNGITQGRCIGEHVSALPLRA
jgi:hypothetical protein